jgi:diguanylate cyclase (GGDEF)-like protein
MPSDWIVLLEAVKPSSAAELDTESLHRLLEAVTDARPIALHSLDRYALQLEVSAESALDALARVLARWSDAVSDLGTPAWDLVRAEIMTSDELEMELLLAERDVDAAAGPRVAGEHVPHVEGDLASDLRWRLMLQDSQELLTLVSEDGTVLFSVAPVETGLLNLLSGEDGAPPKLASAVHPDDAQAVQEAVTQIVAGGVERVTFMARFRCDDGWHWFSSTARNLLADPLVRGVVVSSHDVSQSKELAERVAELTTHDELTGLFNRAVFLDNLELVLARSGEQSQTAVFFVDIDDFRRVIHQVGTPTSDRLLVAVAERLRTGVRDDAIAARLGGDEFALLCEGTVDAAEAGELAKRIADLLSEPIVVDGEECRLTVSIGVALGKAGMLQPATLLRHAEVAMYRARRGRARFEIFRKRRRSSTTSDRQTPP